MKIQNIKFNKIDNMQTEKSLLQNHNSIKSEYASNNLKSYPSNYYINFGTRSIKEVYNTYGDTEMPSTVKNFIDDLKLALPKEKFETLIAQPRLYQIQREAFKELENCHSINDIKKAFPAEKCLKDIKSIQEVPQNGNGIFNLISAKQNQNQKVFDIDEDLSVYIAKQLFYECTSMTDIQKNLASLAIDKEIKEKIENSSTWWSKTFAPLGISVPDGNKYGKTILYSEDRKYSKALSEAMSDGWSNLSPQEVTKRIDSLLQGSKKERLTMIDAWNKCILLRNELSDFLFENLNDNYKIEENDLIVSFYEGNFPIKMKVLMTKFWNSHPQEKIELSTQIKKSRKLYEEKLAQGPEAFEAYEKDILTKRNLIKQKLLEDRQKDRSFDSAKQLIKGIAQQSKQMHIKNPETIEDLYNILLAHITNKQLKIYEQRMVIGNNIEEFSKNYPPHQEIKAAKESLEYSNMMSTQITTILLPDLKRGKISEEEIIAAIRDKEKLQELINKSSKNRTSLELAEYSKMKKLLSQSEKEEVQNVLLQFLPQDEASLSI